MNKKRWAVTAILGIPMIPVVLAGYVFAFVKLYFETGVSFWELTEEFLIEWTKD